MLAQHQAQQLLAEQWVAMTADVAFGQLGGDQTLFGQFHCLGNRRDALGILVDTHAQVELGRIGIGAIGVEQAQDGIAGYPSDLAEMPHLRPSALLATSSVRAAMMKSLRCRPLIEWLHQVTVTLPHSVSRPG